MLPEAAITRDPRVGSPHRADDEAAAAYPSIPAAPHQPGALQHAQVTGDGGQGDVKRAGQGADGRFAARQPGEDGAARGIGEGGEGGVEPARLILNHTVKHQCRVPPSRADQNEMKPPPLNGKRGFTVLFSVDPNRYWRLMKVKKLYEVAN